MGVLRSKVDKICCIHFNQWKPRRILKNAQAVLVEGYFIVKAENGRLYTNHKGLCGHNAFLPRARPWEKAILSCLVKLGEITQAEMDEHIDYYTKIEDEEIRIIEADGFKETAKKLGIKLTPAQLKKLKG